MFTKIRTVMPAEKAVAATLLCGALALGTGGMAFAATPSGSGATPATHRVTCARAPKALTRITKVEKVISRRLPKLQAAEQKATTAGKTHFAARIEARIHRMQKVDTKIEALATKIQARCPSAASGTNSSTA
jgi:hypothetical protein